MLLEFSIKHLFFKTASAGLLVFSCHVELVTFLAFEFDFFPGHVNLQNMGILCFF